MSVTNHPSDIARETLRLLAARRMPPTPDNYLAIYHEIAGTRPRAAAPTLGKHYKVLAEAISRGFPDQQHLAIQISQAIGAGDWDHCRNYLLEFIAAMQVATRIPLSELREALAVTLETAVTTQLLEMPTLAEEAGGLASDIRKASSSSELRGFLVRLRRFAFKLELLAEDQAEMRKGLLSLLRLMVENVGDFVQDDKWLHGQIEVVKAVIDKPLSRRNIKDAERRLKEVIYKQHHLSHSLKEAQDALKNFLSGFVDNLGEFADATTGYQEKIDACASRISTARDISELEAVLQDVMRETRHVQLQAQRSHDEVLAARKQAEEAQAKVRKLENELVQVSDQIRHDPLTGILNRRGLDETLAWEHARARRSQSNLCIAVVDIDNFKRLNDSLGHHAGDAALIHLTHVIEECLRSDDSVARLGGEEFVVLLPDTALDTASEVLLRMQRALTKRFFLHDNQKILITFSAGVTQLQPDEDSAAAIKRADGAMYEAKQAGRNRVVSV